MVATAMVVVAALVDAELAEAMRFGLQLSDDCDFMRGGVCVCVLAGVCAAVSPGRVQRWAGGVGHCLSRGRRCCGNLSMSQIPADATVAYTNLYLIYPLQGFFSLSRRLVYAPDSSRGCGRSRICRGWGMGLSGEELVSAADRATVAGSGSEWFGWKIFGRVRRDIWLWERGAYLGGRRRRGLRRGDIGRFRTSCLRMAAAGTVYAIIDWGLAGSAR